MKGVLEQRAEEFLEEVRKAERELFEEFAEKEIYAPSNVNDLYFSPSWHFRTGLLTREIVEEIAKRGKSVLSVGAGQAYLERFLAERMGVAKEQIVLADKSAVMPRDFKTYIFDMHACWPRFERKFDYVIFPECVLLNVRFETEEQKAKRPFAPDHKLV